jgi:hypothetical protein
MTSSHTTSKASQTEGDQRGVLPFSRRTSFQLSRLLDSTLVLSQICGSLLKHSTAVRTSPHSHEVGDIASRPWIVLEASRSTAILQRVSVAPMVTAGFCSNQCPAVSSKLPSRRNVCSRRRSGFAVASANVTLDNERESSCSVINFDAPGQHFALHQAIAVVKDAGLNTMRISISTDDTQELVKSEFLVTNGNGKLAEVDFEPIRSHLSALSESKTAVDASEVDAESTEYQFVEEVPISEDDMVSSLLCSSLVLGLYGSLCSWL